MRGKIHVTAVAVATLLAACGEISELPVPSAALGAVSPSPRMATAAVVGFSSSGADSIRITYVSSDSSDRGATPWIASGAANIPVLGLRAGASYELHLEARHGNLVAFGDSASFTTPALPTPVAGLRMEVIAGTNPSHGYSVTNLVGTDGHGYVVIFDSAGTVRWYRDFGAHAVSEAKQQANGNITAYVGGSIGNNAAVGAYVEVTPLGDSVRAILAAGSPYTDNHELIVTFDAAGNRVADWLMGYDRRPTDQTAIGFGASDISAAHQILRISSAGPVDTLINGWTQWKTTDQIEPPLSSDDIDHPNSLDFDADGGLVVSYRNLAAVVKVNPATHAIVWQLGGTHNQFAIVGDPMGGFDGQHTVRIFSNGHLLMFDNGWLHSAQGSRAVEYALDIPRKTATMVWQYIPNPPLFNLYTGSTQRLSNGNTVVAFTNKNVIDEVSPSATLLSRTQIVGPPGAISNLYRVTRIENLYNYRPP